MKRTLAGFAAIAAIAIGAFILLSTHSEVASAVVTVNGMHCDNCADKVTKKLHTLNGIKDAEVNWTKGIAKVNYNPEKISIASIESAITELGYTTTDDAAPYSLPQGYQCDTDKKSSDCCAPQSSSPQT